MKKLFVLATAMLAMVAFSAPAFASNQVQLTLTSPTIYKTGCEKAGSVTFSFDGGSTIAPGDWWYMDLPSDVTLCKPIDYVIVQSAGVNGASDVTLNASLIYNASVFNSAAGLNVTDINENDLGPLTVSKVDPNATGNALTNSGSSSNIAFLVKGDENSRRVALYALADSNFTGLTVGNGWKMNIKILDGSAHSNLAADTAAGIAGTAILLNSDGDRTYGESAANNTADTTKAEVIGGVDTTDSTATPYVENTLCVNAVSNGDSVIMTSYASRSDKFTFTGDAQIAHTAAANAVAFKNCTKFAQTGDIVIAGQGGTCTFDYDATPFATATDNGYCDSSNFVGNRVLIEATSGAFGDIDDKYDVVAEIMTDGVYFGGAFATTAFASSDSPCTAASTGTVLTGATYVPYVGTTVATQYAPTNTCTIPSTRQVNKVATTGGSFDLDNYNVIWTDFAAFAYDQSKVDNGTEIKVKVTLNKYPCGTIFSETKTLGTFVTTCGASSSASTLYLPWFPGTAAAGWWGGFAITNYGSAAGSITLTYSDSDGKTATYKTTTDVPAGGQWNSGSITFADLTDVSGFDSTKNFSVKAVCTFSAQGFAFTGNGTEGVGYLNN